MQRAKFKFQQILTYFAKHIPINFYLFREAYFNQFRSRQRTNFYQFRSQRLHISRLKATYFYKFLLISLYFSLFLSISLFAQEDNLEVKGKIETNSLTVQGGASFPASAVKGEVFYRNDENKYYVFDGSGWQEISGFCDKTVASRIVGTSSSRYGSDKTCDGVSDQQEINEAISELGDNKGAVYLLEGEYLVDGEITLDDISPLDSNKSIIGIGAGTSLKIREGVSAEYFRVIHCFSGMKKVLYSQFMIDGNRSNVSITYPRGIDGGYCTSTIDNLWLKDFASHGSPLIGGSLVVENFIWSCGGNGITDSFLTSCNILYNLNLGSWGGAIGLRAPQGALVSYNIIRDDKYPGYGGIWVYYYPSRNIVLGNIVEGVLSGWGISLQDYYSGISNSNILYNNKYGLGICATKSVISNNISSDQSWIGIYLAKTTYSNIFANRSFNTENQGDGLCISASSWNFISFNYIYNDASTEGRYGLSLFAKGGVNSSNNYLVGNYTGGNFDKLIYDNGINTRYTDKLKITLQQGEYTHTGNTISLSSPASYLRLNPSSDITVNTIEKTAGSFSAGDILILENAAADTHRVILNEAGNLCLHISPLNLYQNDTLVLVWDGNNWVETGYSDN